MKQNHNFYYRSSMFSIFKTKQEYQVINIVKDVKMSLM